MSNIGLFDDIDCVSDSKIKARAEKREIKQNLKFELRNSNLETIIKSCGGLPNNNEILEFVSDGTSDTGSFLELIIKEFGVIDEMYLSTWTISRLNVIRLLDKIDNKKIKHFEFLINNGLLKTNSTKSIWGMICDEFNKRNIKYKAINSHAKIFTCKCADKYITVSGSGNWSENPRTENYFVIGGKDSFCFNKKWMQEYNI